MTRPVVVLPLPDSPTRARTSPRPSVRSMPSTARTTPFGRRRIMSSMLAADREVDLEPGRVSDRSARRRGAPAPPASPTSTPHRRRASRDRRDLATARHRPGTGGTRRATPRTSRSGGTPRPSRRPSRTAQRGANRQPGGGSRRSGGEPGMTSSVRRSAWMFGKAASSFCVYGWRGRVKTSATGPSSATRPAYMTITRSHVSAMTDRSWVMRISDRPELAPEVLEQLQDLGLDHDVERGRRLVADDDRRVAGEGHRDHRPLAHPAGQLVRVAAPRASRDADQLEQLAGALPGGLRRLAEPLLDRLGDLVAHALDRVERVHRALEHDRDLAPAVAPQRVLGLGHEVDAHQLDRCRRRSARSTAGCGRATGRSSSCRSRTRRRCRAPRRGRAGSDTPSTALTVPDSSVK